MTRGLEALLRKILNAAAVLFMALAIALGVKVATYHATVSVIDPSTHSESRKTTAKVPIDPKLARLSQLKMSKAGVVVIETVTKPAAPPLSSMIRVKGIMDFGDPKSTEAIIESIRINKTNNYKSGQAVEGVSATVTKIDSAVTFNYDGKAVTLSVNGGESAEVPPTASNGNAPVVADDTRGQRNP